MRSCVARFHRGGQFKELIMHTRLAEHPYFLVSLATHCAELRPKALAGWLPAASVSEARLLSERM